MPTITQYVVDPDSVDQSIGELLARGLVRANSEAVNPGEFFTRPIVQTDGQVVFLVVINQPPG